MADEMEEVDWTRVHGTRKPAPLACVFCAGRMIAVQRLVRFFRHHRRPEDCPAGPESERHQVLKTVILAAAQAAGWAADVEVQGGSWVADVLALHEDRRVAFEVQLSAQSEADARMRTSR